jgi:hypothetical protein
MTWPSVSVLIEIEALARFGINLAVTAQQFV